MITTLSVFSDFFDVLLFGSGSWIGFLLIVALLVVVHSLSKYACIATVPAAFLISLLYLTHTSTNPELAWNGLLMGLVGIFMLIFRKGD
jgi:hypothetical protein